MNKTKTENQNKNLPEKQREKEAKPENSSPVNPLARVGWIMWSVFIILLCITMLSTTAFAYSGDDDIKLLAGGIPFGVKFSTDGVVIVGFCDLDGASRAENPAYSAGLRPKDVILKINGRTVKDAAALTDAIEASGGKELTVTYKHADNIKEARLTPKLSKTEGKFKSGIFVRDSGAGIGTVTYVDPETGAFGGLGHGICDSESGELIPMKDGVVTDVKISDVKKGVSGVPGELKGYFENGKKGRLLENTDCGVYGIFEKIPKGLGEPIPVGSRDDVKSGEAEIICTLSDGSRKSYKIEIGNIKREAEGSKCFIINIKDQELIEKTGGIVQGMSGSPVIQNGKLIGAVTHVLINDPTTGYGIFIENMLANMPDEIAI